MKLKKIICHAGLLCLIIVLAFSSVALAYSGSDYTSNAELAAKLTKLLNGEVSIFKNGSKYKVDDVFPANTQFYWDSDNGYQCYAYANAAYYYLFGDSPKHGDSSYSKSTKISGVKGKNKLSYDLFCEKGIGCGAWIRTTSNSSGSYHSSEAHSIIVLKYDSSNVTFLHAARKTSGGSYYVQLTKKSWSDFNKYLFSSMNRYVCAILQPNITAFTVNPPTYDSFAFQNVVYPKTFKVNTSAGWDLSGGTLVCDKKLKSITTVITTADGATNVSGPRTYDISGRTSYQINDLDTKDGSNNGVRFSFIKNPGSYKWVLTAVDEAGRELKLEMPFTAVSSGSTSTDKASITYNATVPVSSIEIEDPGTLYPDDAVQLSFTVKPDNATNPALKWSSSDSSVATVSSGGQVTAVKKGTATVTATATDGSNVSASISIQVKAIEEMTLAERIRRAILNNEPYNSELDLDNDGKITSSDYVIARKRELGVEINEANFPDSVFRDIIRYYDKDDNGYLSKAELEAAEVMSVPGQNISNLKGVEHFTSLKTLHCFNNQLTSLDVSALTQLVELDCGDNPISSLDVRNNTNLKTLICGNTYLTTIDLSHNPSLSQLMCEQYCYGWNELEYIVVSTCPVLNDLVESTTYSDHTIPGHRYLYNHLLHGWWKANDDDTLAEYLFVGPDVEVHTVKGIYVSDKKKPEPVDQIHAFVIRCYQVILGRDPDEAGLEAWAKALASGEAKASEIIDGFVNSQEFLSKGLTKSQQVEVLYRAMLGRDPDQAGLTAWTKVLDEGYPFGSVINGFCGSTEFIALCKEYGIEPGSVNVGPVIPKPADDTPRGKIEAFVKRCYVILLERGVDPTGLKDWSDALEKGVAQASQIIDGIVNSQEFQLRGLTNEQKVDCLYQAMLGRGADPAGKAAWVQALVDGYPYAAIINGFCGSTEFINICNDYGIQPGSVAVKAAFVKREAITPEGEENGAATVYKGYNSEYINEEKIRAFVEHCYESVLGREGDEEGIANYTALIMNGKKTPKKVAYEFIFSPEFQGKLPGNEEFIRILYKLYLNRQPGAEELAGWVEMLEGGTGLEEIVNGFAESAEFRAIIKGMKE